LRAYRKPKVPRAQHAHPVVRYLFKEMEHQRVGITDLAERAGLNPATVSDWSTRKQPRIADLDAALGVLGYKLDCTKLPEG
jgi:transcriptional regulator with XRE-family HTH domain